MVAYCFVNRSKFCNPGQANFEIKILVSLCSNSCPICYKISAVHVYYLQTVNKINKRNENDKLGRFSIVPDSLSSKSNQWNRSDNISKSIKASRYSVPYSLLNLCVSKTPHVSLELTKSVNYSGKRTMVTRTSQKTLKLNTKKHGVNFKHLRKKQSHRQFSRSLKTSSDGSLYFFQFIKHTHLPFRHFCRYFVGLLSVLLLVETTFWVFHEVPLHM